MTPPRSSYLKRRKPLPKSTSFAKRGGKPKPTNPARRKKAFARCYGSEERVEWVKAQPCCICGGGPCDNAHTEGGGMGRKGPYTSIVPMCRDHHERYDQRAWPFANRHLRASVAACAEDVERRWLSSREGEAA